MTKDQLSLIEAIINRFDYPIWAVKKCLELENYDMDKARERLKNMYFVCGDHPEAVIKENEEMLKEE